MNGAAGQHRQRGAQPRQREHGRLQEEPHGVRGPRLPADADGRARRPRRPPRRRSASRSGLGTRAVATARDFTTGNLKSTERSARPRHRRARVLPDRAARRHDRLHARRRVPPRRGRARSLTAEGMPLEPEITIPPNATSISISKDGIVSVSIAGQTGTAAARHDRARHVPEPGRPARARRQPLRGDDRVGRSDDRRARHRRHRHDRRRASSRTRTSASSRRWST